jgi:hypothetical protein
VCVCVCVCVRVFIGTLVYINTLPFPEHSQLFHFMIGTTGDLCERLN